MEMRESPPPSFGAGGGGGGGGGGGPPPLPLLDAARIEAARDGAGGAGGAMMEPSAATAAAAVVVVEGGDTRPPLGAAATAAEATEGCHEEEEEDDDDDEEDEEEGSFSLAGMAAPREFLTLEWRIAEARADSAASPSASACSLLSRPHRSRKRPLQRSTAEASAVEEGGGCMQQRPQPLRPRATKEERRPLLLQEIAGRSQSGDFTAVIGPSGSGKTTLLHCLSLRVRKFRGALRLNGQSPGPSYTATAALVHQQDVFFGYLTVREHLEYHAAARMGPRRLYRSMAEGQPSAMPMAVVGREEKARAGVGSGDGLAAAGEKGEWETGEALRERQRARVAAVMAEVGLSGAVDTVIGGSSPLYTGKGISGGEMRRLAIATELLLCPSLMFLDEPTSGLDGVTADSVLSSLKRLANKGVLVMASVHCPSSDAARAFTHLLLLTPDGRQAYHGPMAHATAHFHSLGHPLPPACNPCDFFLELVSRTPHCPGASPLHSASIPSQELEEEDEEMGRLRPDPHASTTSSSSSLLLAQPSPTAARQEQQHTTPTSSSNSNSGLPLPSPVAIVAIKAVSEAGGKEGGGAEERVAPSLTLTDGSSSGGNSSSSSSSSVSTSSGLEEKEGGSAGMGEEESPSALMRWLPFFFKRRRRSSRGEEKGKKKERGRQWRIVELLRSDSWGKEEEKSPCAREGEGEEQGEEQAFRRHVDRLVRCYQASALCPSPPLPCEATHQRFPGVVRHDSAGFCMLLRLNLWRGWLQLKRNFIGCFGAMAAALGAVGLLIGLLYAGQATQHGRDLIGMLFAASVTLLFNCAIAHMVRFPLEAAVVLREYLCGANAIGPYVAAKLVSDVPYMLAPLAFSAALYGTAGLLRDWATFWAFTGVVVLMAQAATSLGVALATCSLDPSIGLTLLPVVTAPMVMFSGVLYDPHSVPPSLSWLARSSIVNHGFALLMALEAPVLPQGQAPAVLEFVGVEPSPASLKGHVAALAVILTVSYVATYAGLTLRARFFPPAY